MTAPVRAALAELVPRGRAATLLTTVALVDSVGTGVYLGGSVLLFTRVLGLDPAELGSALAVAGIVGIAASLLWGALADRSGPRGTLVTLNLLRAAGFLAYAGVDGFGSFLAVTVLLGLVEKAMSPVTVAVVSGALEETRRVHTLAVLRSTRNLGLTLGTLLSSLALLAPGRVGLVAVVVGNAVTFALAALLLAFVPQRSGERIAARALPGWRLLARRPRFLAITGLNGFLALHSAVLVLGVPLWTVAVLGLPAPVAPLLIAINTVLAVLLQVRFSRGCEAPGPAAGALRRAGLALATMAALLGVAALLPRPAALVAVALAVLALTAAELWQSAGGWGVSLLLSPEHARSRFLTVFTLGTSAADAVGILLVTGVLLRTGWAGWLVVAVLFALGGLVAARLVPGAVVEAAPASSPVASTAPEGP